MGEPWDNEPLSYSCYYSCDDHNYGRPLEVLLEPGDRCVHLDLDSGVGRVVEQKGVDSSPVDVDRVDSMSCIVEGVEGAESPFLPPQGYAVLVQNENVNR